MTNERITGTVKWFDDKKGFGFIVGTPSDLFFHHSDIEMAGRRSLFEGDPVSFLVTDGEKGRRAVQVKREP